MNKLKQELRDKLLSHLSDHNTEANVNIAFDACKKFSISFISFLRENYELHELPSGSYWSDVYGMIYNEEELFNKFLEQYEKTKTI